MLNVFPGAHILTKSPLLLTNTFPVNNKQNTCMVSLIIVLNDHLQIVGTKLYTDKKISGYCQPYPLLLLW